MIPAISSGDWGSTVDTTGAPGRRATESTPSRSSTAWPWSAAVSLAAVRYSTLLRSTVTAPRTSPSIATS